MILVISWWWFKAFYALWVLKAIEELGLQKKIKACFGVSGGAIVLSWWLSGYTAEKMYDIFINLDYLSLLKPNWRIHQSLIDINKIKKFFKSHLVNNFEDLKKKLYIWTVDLLEGKYILYDSWELIRPLIWSMSLPGIFPGVKYDGKFLVDWWVINNFPTDLAKQKYPDEKIIWIALTNIRKIDKISNIFENLLRSWQLSIESSIIENLKYCDILFYPKLDVRVLDLRKKKLKEIFEKGYKDGLDKLCYSQTI